MTINFYDGTNHDGLFDLLGKVFQVQSLVNTHRGATIPAAVDAFLTLFQGLDPDTERSTLVTSIPAAMVNHQNSANGLMTTMRQLAVNLVIDFVTRDTPLPSPTLAAALTELIRQMVAEAESVDASTVSVTATPGTNTGDGVLMATLTRGDGTTNELVIPETIAFTVSAAGRAPQVVATSLAAQPALSHEWPKGTGLLASVTAVDPSSGRLSNGTFDAFTADVPDGWIAHVATPGTTLKGTTVEVQTVVISGSPVGGYYQLAWTDRDSVAYTTAEITYNASGAAVQSALRKIPGLDAVTVVTTGTAPNYTHTVTFTGQGGNVAQLTSINKLTGGSSPTITHNTTTAGTAQVFRGSKALMLVSDGSELTALYQRVTLTAETVYAVTAWLTADSAPAAGVLKFELVDNIGGTVLSAVTVNADQLTTSWQHITDAATPDTCFLRTPSVLPKNVYFRLRISTAVTSGRTVFLDDLQLVPLNELYAGGPKVAVVTGRKAWLNTDTFGLAVANNRAGLLHEWLDRNCDLRGLGLQLPTNSAGTETIPDSVVG